MGVFFDDDKHKVSNSEFKKIREELYGQGFSHEELERLQGIFASSLGGSESQSGIDKHEMKRTLDSLRSHPSAKLFSPEKINKIEDHLQKYI